MSRFCTPLTGQNILNKIQQLKGLYDDNVSLKDAYTATLNLSMIVDYMNLLKQENNQEIINNYIGNFDVDLRQYTKQLRENVNSIVEQRKKLESVESSTSFECINVNKDSLIPFIQGNDECNYWFDTVFGLEKAKDDLLSGFVYPILYPSLYPDKSKGILLYGPPGTGKTLLAKAVTNELAIRGEGCLKINFYAPQPSALKDKFVGGSEEKIQNLFDCASKKSEEDEKSNKNGKNSRYLSLIFIDEVEGVAGDRSKDSTGIMTTTVNALLQAIDGVKSKPNIIVMAATNLPWELDSAFLRRFDTSVYVTLPNAENIYKQILRELSNYIGKYRKSIQKRELQSIKKEEGGQEKIKIEKSEIEGSCTKPASLESYIFDEEQYKKYVNVNLIELQQISSMMKAKNFSGSDVTRFFKTMVRKSSLAAYKNGFFYNANVDGNSVYLSILGADQTNLNSNNLKLLPNGRDKSSLSSINIKFPDKFVLLANESVNFTSKDYLTSPSVIINDSLIKNYYIYKNENNRTFIIYEFTLKMKIKCEEYGQNFTLNKSDTGALEDYTVVNEKVPCKNSVFTDTLRTEEDIATSGGYTTIEKEEIDKNKFDGEFEQSIFFIQEIQDGFIKQLYSVTFAVTGLFTWTIGVFAKGINKITGRTNRKTAIEKLLMENKEDPNQIDINESDKTNRDLKAIFAAGGYWIFGSLDDWAITENLCYPDPDYFKAFTKYPIEVKKIHPAPESHPMFKNYYLDTENNNLLNINFERIKSKFQNNVQKFENCDELLNENSRYLNWSISTSIMNQAFKETQPTTKQKELDNLNRYNENPSGFVLK